MHYLQRHILQTLTFKGPVRYAEIKPRAVEGNLFTYHLQKLIDQRLVAKRNRKYRLTTKGLRLIEPLSHGTFTERIQPTITTLIACQNRKGEWLLYHRRRQPFPGKLGFPYGKVHLEETVLEAAIREFREKTGLVADLCHRGDAYITIYKDKELISQHLFHVFEGKNPKGEILENPIIGKCFWAKIDDHQSGEFLHGFLEIFKLLRSHKRYRFFAELVYHI
jgi:8-oxo-dGTP pyrophosphatase MutT (NUDIX family)